MKEICVRNSIVCNKCGDEIVSEYAHDFKMCSCGLVGVDGGIGDGYRRIVGSDYTDTSIITASILVVREYLKRNGTTLLKDMDIDWLKNVIIYEEERRPNNIFLPFYREELKLRKDEN